MDTKIYYIPKYEGITITNDFAEIQKRMDIGMDEKIEYIPIVVSDFSQYKIKGLGFDGVDNNYFQAIKQLFSELKLEAISFYRSTIDLSDVIIDVKHLLIGDKSKINLSADNFKNLEEITFLSIKSLKLKILGQFDTVTKATLWDSVKTSSLPEMFPNIEELTVNKGGLTELDLRNNKSLEKLDIHLCTKLERILLPENHKLNKVFIENCKNLDVSNLPPEVTSVWPRRKDTKETATSLKTTGDKDIDNLVSDLKNSMEEYMNMWEPTYSQADIDECISILIEHTIQVLASKSKEEVMEVVKSTILKLNVLNEKCGSTLIETNEREQIAEIIILAGHKMGYNSVDEDITEEWREW